MNADIDLGDPFATAAAAMGAARQAADHLRQDLPGLLGERSPDAFRILADRLERGQVLEAFCRHCLATMIARCERAIAEGTTETMQLAETGCGPDGPVYTPERVRLRTRDAEQLLGIVRVLRTAVEMAERTCDAVAAQTAVDRLRP